MRGAFPNGGVPFRGPYDEDYRILDSIPGSPHFGKLPFAIGWLAYWWLIENLGIEPWSHIRVNKYRNSSFKAALVTLSTGSYVVRTLSGSRFKSVAKKSNKLKRNYLASPGYC